MTISRVANALGSSDSVTMHTGGKIVRSGAVSLVGAFGVVQGDSMKHLWLGTAGAVTSPGATVSTASSTTPVYYEVPAGKIAQIWIVVGFILDSTGTASWSKLGAQTAPASGIKIWTADTDGTTAIMTLVGSAVNNGMLAQVFGQHGCSIDKTANDSALRLSLTLPSPITLTAGQKFIVDPVTSVAYSRGVWSLWLTETDAA